VIEGSGGGGSVKTIETRGAANLPGGVGGTRWYWFTTANMARVPVVALGLGSVAGLGAARLAASHYSVMTRKFRDVRRRSPGGEAARPGSDQDRSSAAPTSRPAPAASTMPSTPRRRRSSAPAFSVLSAVVGFDLPPTTPCSDDPERAENRC
jgi:hypothetical protein